MIPGKIDQNSFWLRQNVNYILNYKRSRLVKSLEISNLDVSIEASKKTAKAMNKILHEMCVQKNRKFLVYVSRECMRPKKLQML